MRHHAIVVTSFDVELLEAAHTKATELGMSVTPVITGAVNFYNSFMVGPDGSKEGWAESDNGNRQRAEYVEWLDEQRHKDDSSNLDWVVVQYGDDDDDTRIVNDSSRRRRLLYADGFPHDTRELA